MLGFRTLFSLLALLVHLRYLVHFLNCQKRLAENEIIRKVNDQLLKIDQLHRNNQLLLSTLRTTKTLLERQMMMEEAAQILILNLLQSLNQNQSQNVQTPTYLYELEIDGHQTERSPQIPTQ